MHRCKQQLDAKTDRVVGLQSDARPVCLRKIKRIPKTETVLPARGRALFTC
jgi:hypothetical protein